MAFDLRYHPVTGLARTKAAGGGGGGYTGPLDIVSGATVAFGQRALSAASRGSAVYTIREDSGNTTQSFDSDATTGDMSVAAITAFLSGANGFVTNWADQSGNGSNVVQATAANQPAWTASTTNSKPGLTFANASVQFLATAGNVSITDFTAFAVVLAATFGASANAVFGENGSDEDGAGYLDGLVLDNANGLTDLYTDGNNGESAWLITGIPLSTATYYVFDLVNTFGGSNINANGVATSGRLLDSAPGPTALAKRLCVGGSDADSISPPDQWFDGNILELIIYPSVLSDGNRTSIRQNIATYYGITL